MVSNAAPQSALLAIDIGSSSVRGLLCDSDAAPLPGTFIQIGHQFSRTADGGATADADALCEMVFRCIDRILTTQAAANVSISTVAIDTFAASVLGTDEGGRPVTPLYTWADARGAALVPSLKAQLDPAVYLQRTGCYVHPSYWPVRLAWLRAAAPRPFAESRYWLSFGAYLLWRLFGVRRTSISAAAWSGLLDRHLLLWDTPTMAILGVRPEQLGEVSDQPLAGLSGEWAARWPALRNARWTPAIGDGAASNIGMGCTGPGRVALSLGTSGAMRLIVAGTPDAVPGGLFCYRLDAGRSLVGGALSNVGSLYRWLSTTLRFAPDADLDAAIAALPADRHGLTVLPYLAGERSPYWDEDIPAAFIGMTAATTPADMLRAGMEAAAYGFRRIWDLLQPLAAPDAQLIAGGGASSSSPVFMQMLTDVIGRPIHAAQDGEVTVFGAALFATGGTTEPPPAREFAPDMSRHAVYQAAMARQGRLLQALSPFGPA